MNSTRSNQKIALLTVGSELREFVSGYRQQAKTIGLVPTMGALHEGHLSLIKNCRDHCDITIVSIYVNPTQFAADEDLDQYPRTLERDLELIHDDADAVFFPDNSEMYPPNFSTRVQPPDVAQPLEGEFRPDHFRGVSTIVLKLFNLVTPDRAFFGQKDFQQVRVIESMVRDLNVPVEIVVCPILRDHDGLALSSRNIFLDQEQRKRALALSTCLDSARQSIRQGETDGHVLMAEMKQHLIDGGVSQIDYAVVADPVTLQTVETVKLPVVLLIAAHVDATRLIDNCLVTADG